jgi:ribosomal-protein-alanine N-acetyltransferase
MPYILENMVSEDIGDVARIERLCFSMPWPISAYKRELKTPETNRYIVLRYVPPEAAQRFGLARPNVQNLTRLVHPELGIMETNNHQSEADNLGSLLSNLLPWKRNSDNGKSESERSAQFPVVGYAGVWLMVDEAHVTTIGVHPDHRGRGAGELLFLGLVDIAEQMRALRMTLEVRVSNTGAQALYRKYGFENAGVRKRYYSDNGEDAYIMWSDPIASPQFQHRIAELRAGLVERMNDSFSKQPPAAHPVDSGKLQ